MGKFKRLIANTPEEETSVSYDDSDEFIVIQMNPNKEGLANNYKSFYIKCKSLSNSSNGYAISEYYDNENITTENYRISDKSTGSAQDRLLKAFNRIIEYCESYNMDISFYKKPTPGNDIPFQNIKISEVIRTIKSDNFVVDSKDEEYDNNGKKNTIEFHFKRGKNDEYLNAVYKLIRDLTQFDERNTFKSYNISPYESKNKKSAHIYRLRRLKLAYNYQNVIAGLGNLVNGFSDIVNNNLNIVYYKDTNFTDACAFIFYYPNDNKYISITEPDASDTQLILDQAKKDGNGLLSMNGFMSIIKDGRFKCGKQYSTILEAQKWILNSELKSQIKDRIVRPNTGLNYDNDNDWKQFNQNNNLIKDQRTQNKQEENKQEENKKEVKIPDNTNQQQNTLPNENKIDPEETFTLSLTFRDLSSNIKTELTDWLENNKSMIVDYGI